MVRWYRLYGLSLRSAIALPGKPVARAGRPHVRFAAGPAGGFPGVRADRSWFQYQPRRDGSAFLRWHGLFEFVVSADGRDIRYRRLPRASTDAFQTYLLSQVLSFALLARGTDPLHATVLEIGGGAVALLGECGTGKSTLGSALLARGFPLLTDDLFVVTPRGGGFVGHPGPPRLKLFPSVARRLGRPRAGSPMNPGTGKLVLPLSATEMVRRAIPLRALYVLDRLPARRAGSPVTIEPLTGAEALVETLRASFNLIRTDRARIRRQFAFATRLARAVPIRRIRYRSGWTELHRVCRAILADLAAGPRAR